MRKDLASGEIEAATDSQRWSRAMGVVAAPLQLRARIRPAIERRSFQLRPDSPDTGTRRRQDGMLLCLLADSRDANLAGIGK